MVTQEEASVVCVGVTDHATATDVGAVVDKIVEEGRAIDRVGLGIRIIQGEHVAIDEAVADDLGVVGRLIGSSIGSIVQAGKRSWVSCS